jgi:transposase InsO family protein
LALKRRQFTCAFKLQVVRVTHELGRRGVMVNHKHVQRLMRDDNLLWLHTRGFLHTPNS